MTMDVRIGAKILICFFMSHRGMGSLMSALFGMDISTFAKSFSEMVEKVLRDVAEVEVEIHEEGIGEDAATLTLAKKKSLNLHAKSSGESWMG